MPEIRSVEWRGRQAPVCGNDAAEVYQAVSLAKMVLYLCDTDSPPGLTQDAVGEQIKTGSPQAVAEAFQAVKRLQPWNAHTMRQIIHRTLTMPQAAGIEHHLSGGDVVVFIADRSGWAFLLADLTGKPLIDLLCRPDDPARMALHLVARRCFARLLYKHNLRGEGKKWERKEARRDLKRHLHQLAAGQCWFVLLATRPGLNEGKIVHLNGWATEQASLIDAIDADRQADLVKNLCTKMGITPFGGEAA